MDSIHIFLIANFYSKIITEYLGIFAVLAFGVTVGGVFLLLSRDIASKQLSSIRQNQPVMTQRSREDLADTVFQRELKAFDKECQVRFNDSIESCRLRLRDLVLYARSSLGQINGFYSKVYSSAPGESDDEARGRYVRACRAQWIFLKEDLGFVGFKELEAIFSQILDRSILDEASPVSLENSDNEIENRGVEVRCLHQSIPFEKFGIFYHDYLSSVDAYKSYFRMHMKEWFVGMNLEIVKMIRFTTAAGVTINDTEHKPKFVRLKNILDTIDKLSERLDSNSSEIGDEDAAFMQVLFGGVVLGIISDLPGWFLEIGDLGVEEPKSELACR